MELRNELRGYSECGAAGAITIRPPWHQYSSGTAHPSEEYVYQTPDRQTVISPEGAKMWHRHGVVMPRHCVKTKNRLTRRCQQLKTIPKNQRSQTRYAKIEMACRRSAPEASHWPRPAIPAPALLAGARSQRNARVSVNEVFGSYRN